MSQILNDISIALEKGDLKVVIELCNKSLTEGIGASDILNALLSGMNVVGERFKNNEIFIPEVLIAARAMNKGLEIIRPLLDEEGVDSIGKVAIGTVKGDLHDIGKNLVGMMMAGAGFEVIDLGVDVSPEQYIQAVKDHKVDIICMSALLTTTMTSMKEVVVGLEEHGLRDSVKVMVGGAPVTDNFAEQIGADKYTADAATAAEEAKKFVA